MAVDPSIALQIKSPDMVGTIGNMLNIGKAQTDLQTQLATQPAEIARQKAASELTQTTAQRAKFQLTGEQFQVGIDQATGLLQDPSIVKGDSEGSIAAIAEAKDRMIAKGVPRATVEAITAPLIMTAVHNPNQLRTSLANIVQGGIGASGQAAQNLIPAGQQQTPAGAGVSGQPIQYMRDQFGNLKIGTTPTQGAPGGIQVAPGLGQAAGVQGVLEPVTKDWADTQASAANASRNIGILQNIKQFAPGAVTGVGNERRSYIAGLAGLLGMSEQQLERTNTDLLAKNANMLALAGGNTDAARALAESANPNVHMTPQAIQHAADQVISQQQLALKKQEFLQSHIAKAATDPNDRGTSYTKALSQWNQVADPRILQLSTMSPEEKIRMKQSMSPAEQKAFGEKLKKAHQMGIL